MNTKSQYQDSSRLKSRIQIHKLYSINKYGWQKWVFDHLKFPAKSRILEIGCGNGILWRENHKQIKNEIELYLSDISIGMIQDCKINLRDLKETFLFTVCDARNIPFKNNIFNSVIANHMLFHTDDLDKTLSEIKRIIKPDGYLYAATNGKNHMKELNELTQFFFPDFKTGEVTKSFTLENGKDKLRKYFSNIEIHYYKDYLVINKAKPLVDYILSTVDEVDRSIEVEITNYIQGKIYSEGVIKISKESGMFEAF
ncbi:methyltransferase domain-containing protein [Candidatus Poribacteria bacterium]|nr:methyltransferase domain-containing protein [Candidatus Poribacteria bacterium]